MPAAYYATLPIRAMVKAMRAAGFPSDISDAPGTHRRILGRDFVPDLLTLLEAWGPCP